MKFENPKNLSLENLQAQVFVSQETEYERLIRQEIRRRFAVTGANKVLLFGQDLVLLEDGSAYLRGRDIWCGTRTFWNPDAVTWNATVIGTSPCVEGWWDNRHGCLRSKDDYDLLSNKPRGRFDVSSIMYAFDRHPRAGYPRFFLSPNRNHQETSGCVIIGCSEGVAVQIEHFEKLEKAGFELENSRCIAAKLRPTFRQGLFLEDGDEEGRFWVETARVSTTRRRPGDWAVGAQNKAPHIKVVDDKVLVVGVITPNEPLQFETRKIEWGS